MSTSSRFASRRTKLIQQIRKQKLPALLVTNEINVRYLTGFTGDSTWLLISPDLTMLISDGRFTTQLADECPDLSCEIRPVSKTLVQATGEILAKQKLTACGFEATALSFEAYSKLKDGISAELVSTSGLVEELRAIKDAAEIEEIRVAVHQAEKGFAYLRSTLTPDMTERQVAFTLEAGMRRFGAEGASFPIIAAVGPQAALPHARPGELRVEESPFMLVDWGARSPSGYVSDLTRMIVTGSISSKLQRLYEVVKTAQEQALAAIAPGVRGRDIDRIARGAIEDARLGKRFNHSLGHGIGLEVHEAIRLSPTSDDELRPGMVVTVEPGVYWPGWGGIRLEDDVLITPDGCEILSSWPKELESCRVVC